MSALRTIGCLGLTLAGLLALSGCTASAHVHGKDEASTAAPAQVASDQAVRCDKCKVTWVQRQQSLGNPSKGAPVYGYRETQQMECPDCRSAVANFFSTGKLEHTCKTCGGNMTPCQGH